MMDYSIEKMHEGHIPGLVEIEKECFSHPWTFEGFQAELDNDCAHFYAAVDQGKPIGYIGFHAVLDEGYMDNLAVLTEYRRQGIAAALLQYALDRCKELDLAFLSLEVRKSNGAAISLYEKYGFKKVGERKRFYTAPTEDAYIMTVYFNDSEDKCNAG